jgi:hypothetical protein
MDDILRFARRVGLVDRPYQREPGAFVAGIQAHSLAQMLQASGDVTIHGIGGTEHAVRLG